MGRPQCSTGGGHFWAAGIPGNTEFPERWDEEGVRQAVERTLLAPELARYDRIIETLHLYREDDDVLVFAVLRRRRDGTWRFVTSFPLNGRGVVRNHPLTGESEPMPLDREVWTTYPGGDE